MRLDPESAHLLGWEQLKKALASFTYTPQGKKKCLSMEPMADSGLIEKEHSRHKHLRFLLDQGKAPPLATVEQIELHLHRAQKGGILEPEAITSVAQAMGISSRVRRYLMIEGTDARAEKVSGVENSEALVDLARGSCDLSALARDFLSAFGHDGRLRDSASAELFSLRRKAESLADSIRNKLEHMIRNKRVGAALSDPIVTMRGDRYVLPVSSHSRSEVKGIVHDTSHTGATLFIEPSLVVDDGNRLKIARAAVSKEERKILAQYSAEIAQVADQLRDNMHMLARVDVLNASIKLAITMNARLPELSSEGFYLKGARHPLMLSRAEQVVANDIELQHGARALILSGPNAGGKTVALKTLGLCCLMAQAGLAIPVDEGSRVGLFDHIAAVIGDAQDIGRGLSTFSAHVKKIIEILNEAGGTSLVLLDELIADTDPQQGAALATAILRGLVDIDAFVVTTTHYESLKLLAFEDQRFSNASVGFDLKRMKPTFCLHADTPGRSLTLDIARRMGMPEYILSQAAGCLQNDERNLEQVLFELEQERQHISSLRDELDKARTKAQQESQDHCRAKQEFEQKKQEIISKGRQNILEEISEVRKEVSKVIEDLRSDAQMGSAVKASHKLIGMQRAVQNELSQKNVEQEPDERISTVARNLKPGDRVKLKHLGKIGRVTSVDRRGHLVTVQLGSIRTRVAAEQTQLLDEDSPKPKMVSAPMLIIQNANAPINAIEVRSSANTLDLRGKRVDEALCAIDEFLDGLFGHAEPSAFIIHGHGTGALKTAVRQYLIDSPYASHFRSGLPEEGGDGVTVVTMR